MAAAQRQLGKAFLQATIGGVVGYCGARYALGVGLGKPLIAVGFGAFALAAVGLVYLLMGLFVGLGVAFPQLGAKVLNVAERADIDDQRAILAGSAVGCGALGLGMILLALAGRGGILPAGVGIGAFVLVLILAVALSVLQWRRYDELWRGVSIESGAATAALLVVALAVWGALAQTGLAVLPDPAGLIALVMGLTLLGCFIAAGRRGLLVQG